MEEGLQRTVGDGAAGRGGGTEIVGVGIGHGEGQGFRAFIVRIGEHGDGDDGGCFTGGDFYTAGEGGEITAGGGA